jgi:hypothetical protein
VFQVTRDRDAFGSIRGFVYQVALTIERWIGLPAAAALELERGEDIDICHAAVGVPEDEARRTLEQVKRLEGSVTLRSPDVIEFLAGAHEHRTSNPDLGLVFRFVTTARMGTERPTPLVPRQPAMSRWATLCASFDVSRDGRDLAGIRELLRGTDRPSGLNAGTWDGYASFVRDANDAALLAFMRQVEWSTGCGGEDTVRARVRDELVERDLVEASEAAEAAYRNLFFHVFQVLAQPGLKRLSAAEFQEQLTRQPRTHTELAAFARLESMFASLEVRVDEMEAEVAVHRQQIAALALAPGVRTDVVAVPNPITFGIPPAVPLTVPRQTVVGGVRDRLANCRVLVLLGEPGYGKTQVARLAAADRLVTWVRLRRGAAADAADTAARATTYALQHKHECVVLDDAGRIADADPITELLLAFVEQPFRVLITSPFALPGRLLGDLGASQQEFQLPPFSAGETRELLAISGAPEALLASGVVDLIRSVTRGHPTLLRAAVEYLRQRGWDLEEKSLRGLFAGEYAVAVRDSAQRLLRETMPDEAARQLLYRLDLVVGGARRREIEAAAAVNPVVALPLEKVADCLGLWLQDDVRGRFSLSPMLLGTGEQMLEAEVARGVYLALAETITAKRQLSAIDVARGLHYLTSGGAYDQAGALYVAALTAFLDDMPKGAPAPFVFSSWLDALPKRTSPGINAAVRAAQVRLQERTGGDARKQVDALVAELDAAEMRPGSPEVPRYLYASLSAGPFRATADAGTAVRLTRVALRALAAMQLPHGEPVAEEIVEAVHASVWLSGAVVRTTSAAKDWVALLRSLSPEALQRSLARSDVARGAMFFMPRMIVVDAAQRGETAFSEVAATLAAIEEAGQERGLPLLSASAAAANIMLLAEYRKEIDAATHVAQRALDRYAADRDAEFTIREAHANQLVRSGRTSEAVATLERAIETGSSTAPVNHVRVAIRISALTRADAPERSLHYARRAVELARAYSQLPRSELVRALAELAIAVADIQGAKAGFEPWRDGALQLLTEEPRDDSERGLFAVFGHCLGYYLGMASIGRPPDTIDSGEPYAKPIAGMFLQDSTRAATVYRSGRRALLAVQVEMYADAAKDPTTGIEWGRRAVELLERGADDETRALVTNTALPFQLRDGAFAVAISGGAAAGLLAARRARADAVQLNDAERLRVEGFARFVALVPAYLRAATLNLQRAPTADAAAAELANVCRARANGSGDPLWELAASIVETSLLKPVCDRTTADLLKQQATESGEISLRSIASLAESLRDDVTPAEAIAAQLPVFDAARARLETPAMTRLIVLEFLEVFWRGTLARSRFRFSAPRLYEAELADAVGQGNEKGVRSLISATVHALSLSIPAFARDWLATGSRA